MHVSAVTSTIALPIACIKVIVEWFSPEFGSGKDR